MNRRQAKKAVISMLMDSFVAVDEVVDQVLNGGYVDVADESDGDAGRVRAAAYEMLDELTRRAR